MDTADHVQPSGTPAVAGRVPSTAVERPAGAAVAIRRGQAARALLIRAARAPETWVVVAALVHVAFVLWFIVADTRTPETESGRQLGFTIAYVMGVEQGDPFRWFEGSFSRVEDLYPPVHHLIGMVWSLIFGTSINGIQVAQMLVYLPLMVIGTYGAGRVAYGRMAGALAAIFLMAIPLFGLLFKLYLVDTAVIAFTAPAIWLLLLSRRFERTKWAFAAGVVIGLGMLTKYNFLYAWIGVVAIMLLRGGWRNWRGLIAFALPAAAVMAPWYLAHIPELRQQAEFLNQQDTVLTVMGGRGAVEPFSNFHLGYYPRLLVGYMVFVPLLAFSAVGVVTLAWRYVRERRKDDFTPELIAGGLVFWAGSMLGSFAEWRYFLPILVYIALLGTGWIGVVRRRVVRAGAIAALAAIFVINLIGAHLNEGPQLSFTGPRATLVTFSDPGGLLANRPVSDSRLDDVLAQAADDGIRRYWVFGPTHSPPFFDTTGLNAMALAEGIHWTPETDLTAEDIGILLRQVNPGDPPPCSWLSEDRSRGVYVVRGPVQASELEAVVFGGDPAALRLYCPHTRPRE